MDISSTWTAMVTATSTISGQNTLSCTVKGSPEFTVFLSEVAEEIGGPVIPQNSVAGRMAGSFDAQVSTTRRQVSGSGLGEWTIGGTYDPATESISIAIRSSGVDAKGTNVVLGKAIEDAAPAVHPFTMKWNWGVPTPRADDPSTVLEVMKPPTLPVISSEREVDLLMVDSLPQTGLTEFQHLVIDLKDSKPQTVIQTFQDESGLGTRTTTWVFALIPLLNIERVDRATDGRNSFVSTDSISFRMAIPGVTVAKSGWTNVVSWNVKGLSPLSGSGVPSQLPHSPTFGFQPKPASRPTGGSTVRNRPIQYRITASFEDTPQYFLLAQDDVDLLRQEYIDHNEAVVPSRSDCVAHPIDNSFNVGNYNVAIDGGMQAALEKVALEFGRDSKGSVRVASGFRSPQRNKATGDVHPNNKHVLGRALDLVPNPASADALLALYQACVRAGYHSFCEAAPGKQVPLGSPDAKQVHIDW